MAASTFEKFKLREPTPFTGQPGTLNNFLIEVELQFAFQTGISKEIQIAYVISNMRGGTWIKKFAHRLDEGRF